MGVGNMMSWTHIFSCWKSSTGGSSNDFCKVHAAGVENLVVLTFDCFPDVDASLISEI